MADIFPASTRSPIVGVLGGGQLGRMMATEAHRLGVEIIALDPAGDDSPTGQVTRQTETGSFRDSKAIRALAARCDILTCEIEHVDTNALMDLEDEGVVVRPGGLVLAVVQDKLVQKRAMAERGVAMPRFREVGSAEDVLAAGRDFGFPLVLKSRTLAYDGKGNVVVRSAAEAAGAIAQLGSQLETGAGGSGPLSLMAEAFVPFTRELAVMVAADVAGTVRAYPVVETVQRDSVCHSVIAPAAVSAATAAAATAIATDAVRAVGGAGVFGVELFELADGRVLYNEIAPRPHNSGHYTIEACAQSQFATHLRCVLGLPLRETDVAMRVPVAGMVNVLGAATATRGEDRCAPLPGPAGRRLSLPLGCVARVPGATVHWYGKRGTRPGRKIGHVTVVAESWGALRERMEAVEAAIAEEGL